MIKNQIESIERIESMERIEAERIEAERYEAKRIEAEIASYRFMLINETNKEKELKLRQVIFNY